MNSIALTGRLTREPELCTLPTTGEPVCKMRLAVDRMGRGEDPGYIDVTTFGKQGEACAQVLSQGWLVAVDGRLEYREWTTDDGAKRSGVEIIGRVEFLAAPRSTEPAAEPDLAAA